MRLRELAMVEVEVLVLLICVGMVSTEKVCCTTEGCNHNCGVSVSGGGWKMCCPGCQGFLNVDSSGCTCETTGNNEYSIQNPVHEYPPTCPKEVGGSQVCHEISLSHSSYLPVIEGKYILMAEQGCGGKPSWKHESGLYFLYEKELRTIGVQKKWLVGHFFCKETAVLQAPLHRVDSPLAVPSVPHYWLEFNGTDFAQTTCLLSCTKWAPETCASGYDDWNCICGQCVDECDPVTGHCTCQDWWVGNTCKQYIGYLSMADNSVSLSAITATSAIVKWTKISNVPDGLQENYVYQVQYRQPHSEWKTSMSVSHDPGCASVQEIEVGDLEANQQYEVRLKSFRVVRGTWDAMTETVTVSFDTPCQAPKVPELLVELNDEAGDKLPVVIGWEPTDVRNSGCNNLTEVRLQYRDRHSQSSDWVNVSIPTDTTTTVTLWDLSLVEAAYTFRLTFANDGGFSAYSEAILSALSETISDKEAVTISDMTDTGCSTTWPFGLSNEFVLPLMVLAASMVTAAVTGCICYRRGKALGRKIGTDVPSTTTSSTISQTRPVHDSWSEEPGPGTASSEDENRDEIPSGGNGQAYETLDNTYTHLG